MSRHKNSGPCSFPGCTRPAASLGRCRKCYAREWTRRKAAAAIMDKSVVLEGRMRQITPAHITHIQQPISERLLPPDFMTEDVRVGLPITVVPRPTSGVL